MKHEIQAISEDLSNLICNLLCDFSLSALPEFMKHQFSPRKKLKAKILKVIKIMHDDDTKTIHVTKRGYCRNQNRIIINSICIKIGKICIKSKLYTVHLIYESDANLCTIILQSSTCKKSLFQMNPKLGDEKQCDVLEKCEHIFSCNASYKRIHIDILDILQSKLENLINSSSIILKQYGNFSSSDLECLLNLEPEKLKFIIMVSISNIIEFCKPTITPNIVYVVIAKRSIDFENFSRYYKAIHITSQETSHLDIKFFNLYSCKGIEHWKKSYRFTPLSYKKSDFAKGIFKLINQLNTKPNMCFNEVFPCLPVIVGGSLFPNEMYVKISMNSIDFNEEELILARKFVATLIHKSECLFSLLEQILEKNNSNCNVVFNTYYETWFKSWYSATGNLICSKQEYFNLYTNVLNGLEVPTLETLDDKKSGYQNAIDKLLNLSGNEEWILNEKPKSYDELSQLFQSSYCAFNHVIKRTPVLCFTNESLIRYAGLKEEELEYFIEELKNQNILLNNTRTHNVNFGNGRGQIRVICIKKP